MKKFLSIILATLLLLLLILPIFADGDTVVVPKNLLTDDQKAKLDAQQSAEKVNTTIKQVSSYVGLGKEIGQAVDGSLSALTNRANEFANTKVGTWTMWIVAYKILGQDAKSLLFYFIRLLIGIPVLIAGIIIWLNLYRKEFITYSVLISKDKMGNKTYEKVEPIIPDAKEEFSIGQKKFTYACILGLFLIIICLIFL